jgi:hypothetical protein
VSAPAAVRAVPGAPAAVAPPPATVPAQTRRAALLVHALPLSDRDWLLRRLPDGERVALGALIAELESLGIPADPALVGEVVGARPDAPQPASPATGAGPATAEDGGARAPLAAIERGDPATLATLLRDEPVGLVVRLLALRAWPWREEVLRQLGEILRRQIEERLERDDGSAPAGDAPALREHLLTSLARRLRDAAEAPASAGRAEPVRARRSRARGWLGRLWPARTRS